MSRNADHLQIVSHFPGRLRVRADKFRAKGVAAEAAERIRAEPGVTSVAASELTGGLLILYDPALIPLDRLLPAVLAAGELAGVALAVDEPPAGPPGRRLRQAFRRVDDQARQAMKGRLDVRTTIPALCMIAGLARFAAGNRVLPRWYEMTFWSFITFINFNPRD